MGWWCPDCGMEHETTACLSREEYLREWLTNPTQPCDPEMYKSLSPLSNNGRTQEIARLRDELERANAEIANLKREAKKIFEESVAVIHDQGARMLLAEENLGRANALIEAIEQALPRFIYNCDCASCTAVRRIHTMIEERKEGKWRRGEYDYKIGRK